MKHLILSTLFLLVALSLHCQTEESNVHYNFDFENVENGQPVDWWHSENSVYQAYPDSLTKKSGKYSAAIEYQGEEGDFAVWTYSLPKNYKGRKITLSGYIKTENVKKGWAGLWMRIDPEIAFDNMEERGIKGTTDWTKYEITLKMNPKKTTKIVFGGMLVGSGKMWIDDLKVTIDGKKIENLEPYERPLLPAEKDTVFNQGSGIETIASSQIQIDNLKTLGLIWGYLKYYHPCIAAGNYNWDYELFRILPKVVNAENQKTRDQILVDWITGLGSFKEGNEKKIKSSDTKIEPDLDWINMSGFSAELTTLLLKVKTAKRSRQHYYVDRNIGAGPAEFTHENEYSPTVYADPGYRILCLYRYWNIIQYYFPYKYLIGEDWKNVLVEFIPKMIDVKTETEYMLAVSELTARINDSHAGLWDKNPVLTDYLGANCPPLQVTFIENKAVVMGFYENELLKENGMMKGDVISKINGKTIEEIIKVNLKYTSGSNYSTQLRQISLNLLRTNDSTISIEYYRDGILKNEKLKTYSVDRFDLSSRYHTTDTCFRKIGNDIAYIYNANLKRADIPRIWEEFKNTKGLIIDNRNYPMDGPLYVLSDYLLPEKTQFVKMTKPDIKTPGLFTYIFTFSAGKKNKNAYNGKIIILVNESTQSASEFHAMAYKVHPKATVIGSTTAGADGNVTRFSLPGEILTWISGMGVYYPDGGETQRVGIVPDVTITPTIKGVKEGRDELVEKAIEMINAAQN